MALVLGTLALVRRTPDRAYAIAGLALAGLECAAVGYLFVARM